MTSFVLRNVRLVELDRGRGYGGEPVDVRVVDERVESVGREVTRPAGIPELDGEGRWLMPGLWDAHVHLGQWALASQRLDLGGTESLAEALDRVTSRLAMTEGPLIAWGHRPAAWDPPATVTALDEVTGARPTVLIAGDGHHAWMNSVALDALDLPRREGMVEEVEWFQHYPRLALVLGEDGESPAAYLAVQQSAAALGIVGITDLEFGRAPHEWPDRASAAGLLKVRVGTYPETLEDYLALGLRTGDRLGEDARHVMGPLKIISDGSLNTRTAWCCEPYHDAPTSGAANLSVADLHSLMTRAREHGLEVAAHAIGDAAVSQALDAYAATGAVGTIEHAQLVDPADLPRMAELGVRASVQPAHLLDDRDATVRSWPDRTDRCFMLRAMADAGVTLAMGSDAPVARLDPWLAAAAAVHRTADDREPWHPEQALTAREALAASVDGLGTVHAGMPADLVLVDDDPLTTYDESAAVSEHLLSTSVARTWIDGELVHTTVD